MSYSADFATADPANAPLDAPLLIGADPFVWGALLLALVVAAMLGWLAGSGSRAKRSDAAGAIWAAIDAAAKAAMKADTDALPARASDLYRELRARLGRTLHFGGELAGCVQTLDAALKGEVEDKPASAAHGHDRTPEAELHEPAPEQEPSAPPSPAASVVVSVVHHGAAASPPRPEKPGKRPMSTRERNDALRLAVAAFNDHWRHRAAREADMRAILAELSDSGPRGARTGGH